jgi:hypothetical protein
MDVAAPSTKERVVKKPREASCDQVMNVKMIMEKATTGADRVLGVEEGLCTGRDGLVDFLEQG